MRLSKRLASIALGLALSTGLSVTLGFADEACAIEPSKADEAKARYGKANELAEEGDFASALIEFKRSYEAVPNFNVLYNIGQIHYQLSDYANALRVLQQYLDDGGKRIVPARRESVEKDIEKLKLRVATVTVKINTKDAEVRVDDLVVDVPPNGQITVSAGKRRFEVSKQGYKSVSRVEEVAGQEAKELTFELSQEATVINNPDESKPPIIIMGEGPKTPPPPPPKGAPVIPIVLWSITGVTAIGTAVTGGLALSSDGTATDLKREPGRTEMEIEDQTRATATYALVSDILLATTLVGATAATIFTVIEVSDESDASAPKAEARLKVGPLGLSLEGSF